ncbi:MAG: T9SS type A sorting domain-containing protein, partial [Bacteroidota bacterium]
GGERFVIATDGAANIGGGGPEWSLRERQVVTSFLTPNPVADELTLNYALSSEAGSVSWRIVDLSGRQVLGAELGQGAAHGHYVENIDVARLSAGIYLFTLRVGAEWRTEKLVVQ